MNEHTHARLLTRDQCDVQVGASGTAGASPAEVSKAIMPIYPYLKMYSIYCSAYPVALQRAHLLRNTGKPLRGKGQWGRRVRRGVTGSASVCLRHVTAYEHANCV